MPHVVWSNRALFHLSRLSRFLAPKSARAAGEAIAAIRSAVRLLEQFPEAGPLTGRVPGHRDLVVRYGTGGYVVRYVVQTDSVIILWVRHQRERPQT